MDKNSLINIYYEEYSFPSVDKLYRILKSEEPDAKITRQDIENYVSSQKEGQTQKVKKQNRKLKGHVTALDENELWLMDIFDLHTYSRYNSGYKYIFAVMDVFTRKAYVIKMKTKTIDDTSKALEEIISKSKVKPSAILSDNDSSFLGGKFQKLLDKHNIFHMTNTVEDHKALGIIDNFAKRIKTTLGKYFARYDTANWIDYLDKIVKQYNNTPHSALYELSPNQVTQTQENKELIQDLNFEKMHDSGKVTKQTEFKPGDKVRVSVKTKFTKSNQAQFSNDTYTIESVKGNNILLDNGKTYKPYSLIKSKGTETLSPKISVVQKAEQEQRQERKVKQEGIQINQEPRQMITRSQAKKLSNNKV